MIGLSLAVLSLINSQINLHLEVQNFLQHARLVFTQLFHSLIWGGFHKELGLVLCRVRTS